ncbi:effector binding domain-containing protein [Clostridiaceae bacterium M8S5]|nr:effector binding domain-containing protein [Clostridiaceae bacterium M8S5]
MKVKIITKKSFKVLGKLGEGNSNEGFKWVPPLWEEANEHFNEIAYLAKRDANDNIVGMWGAMSDVDESFNPWGSNGKYLAGCEVVEDAIVQDNWTLWQIPSYKYATIKCTQETYGNAFTYMSQQYLPDNNYTLAGAVHEYYPQDAKKGEVHLYFPVERI